jgi:hypothetical protein
MKLLAIILLLSACTTTRFVPQDQHQVRLQSWQNVGAGKFQLSFTNKDKDTMLVLYGHVGMDRIRFEKNAWYTISDDTTKFKMINGHKYFECRIKKNN